MNFVAIDFETANRYRNSACSVALVTVENGQISGSTYSLIKPPVMQFDYWNTRIHGITAKDVEDKPTFAELWETIKPYLDGKIVVAHNAAFDVSVLNNMLAEYGLPKPDFRHTCTVTMARRVWPGEESYRLSALASRFGIDFEHHNALHDARTCAMLALEAARSVKAGSFLELTKRIGVPLKEFS